MFLLLAAVLAFPANSPLKAVKVREVLPGIYHLDFPSNRLLASTFLRFQETYESPKFHGKVFTKAEFLAWYEKKSHGAKASYFDWDGFNVPSRMLKRFYAGDFDPLDENEKALLALFSGMKGDFYVIGTSGKDSLRHEIAHGLYATNPEYRARALAIIKEADLKPVFAMLERLGYDKSVWDDEAQAWLGDSDEEVAAEGLDPKPTRGLHERLLALYARYAAPASKAMSSARSSPTP